MVPRRMARWTRSLGLAAAAGVLAGLAAAALEFGLHEGSAHLVGRFTDLGEARVLTFRPALLLLPTIGGLAAGLLVHWLCPRLVEHGTELLIRSFHRQGGMLPLRGPTVHATAAVGVIACGGSAGPEGPIAALGAAIGSSLGRVFSLTPRERRIMLVAGCGAGVGAIFQCPLGGALFAVSVLYQEPDYETDAIMPSFIASVVAYSVYMPFWGYGHHLLHGANTLNFSSPRELVPYAVLGPLCALLCLVIRNSLRSVQRVASALNRHIPNWLTPALGGLATGAIACVLPQVMDGQYLFIQKAMDSSFVGGFEAHSWWTWALLFAAVAVAKCIATSCTVGSGAPGGVLGPIVFVGGVAGALVGAVFTAIAPELFTSDPENLRRALIPVGMAGVLSAGMRVPLAALVMVIEMTGSYGLIVPLMVVCVSSYLVGRRWGLSEEQVRSSPESPAHAGDVIIHLLEGERVAQVMNHAWPDVVRCDTTLGEIVSRSKPGTRPVFAVVDDGHLQGLISLNEITNVLEESGISDLVIAADIMAPQPATLCPEDDLYVALSVMAHKKASFVPVVAGEDDAQFLGMLTRGNIHKNVRNQLEALREHLVREHAALAGMEHEEALHQLVVGVPAGDSARVQRLIVPVQAVGKTLREADFRQQFGVQVIGIEHADGSIQCPPDVDVPLRTDQRLIGILTPAAEDGEHAD